MEPPQGDDVAAALAVADGVVPSVEDGEHGEQHRYRSGLDGSPHDLDCEIDALDALVALVAAVARRPPRWRFRASESGFRAFVRRRRRTDPRGGDRHPEDGFRGVASSCGPRDAGWEADHRSGVCDGVGVGRLADLGAVGDKVATAEVRVARLFVASGGDLDVAPARTGSDSGVVVVVVEEEEDRAGRDGLVVDQDDDEPPRIRCCCAVIVVVGGGVMNDEEAGVGGGDGVRSPASGGLDGGQDGGVAEHGEVLADDHRRHLHRPWRRWLVCSRRSRS